MKNNIYVRLLIGILSIVLLIGVLSNSVYQNSLKMIVVIIIVTMNLLFISRWAAPKLDKLSTRIKYLLLIGSFVIMIIIQIIVLQLLPVTVYHDPLRVLLQAEQMSHGDNSWSISYFWRYPNNVTIAYLLSKWLHVTNLLGLTTNISMNILGIVSLDAFIGLLSVTVYQLNKKFSSMLGVVLFFALTPFAYTYYLQVFYSDILSLIILLVIFRQLFFWNQRPYIYKCLVLAFAVAVGQILKPNMIVLLPACLLIIIILALSKKFSRKIWIPVMCILVGFALSVPVRHKIEDVSHYAPKTHYQLPVTSWMLMGMNENTQGRYSGTDIGHQLKIKHRDMVSYDVKHIQKRLRRMGPLGIGHQVFNKLLIFFNVQYINNWYNGGLQQTPNWYAKKAQQVNNWNSILAQIGFLILLISALIRLFKWTPELANWSEQMLLLLVIMLIGYASFHGLLWETESRYGQIFLPALFLIQALIPTKSMIKDNWLSGRKVGLLAGLSGLLLLGGINLPSDVPVQVIAAQRSQMSKQYGAKPMVIKSGTVIKQKVQLHDSVNYFSVQSVVGSELQASLTNIKTHKTINLGHGNKYSTHQLLPAGEYEIILRNNTKKDQAVSMVKSVNYKFTENPLYINQHGHSNYSLIFKALKVEN